jgi:2-phospho-L-lactate guanylyltransferase
LKPHRRANVEAIVPANILKASKARLAPCLTPSNRSRLSVAMLFDVLHALTQVREVERVTVVSADQSVQRITRLTGTHFLWEGERRGLNKGLRLAVRDASWRRASAALILPSDIPLITPHEVRRFLTISDGYSVALTPSKDGGGTNALLLRPPGIMNPAFGKNSLQRHLSLARRNGLPSRVVKLRRIAVDVDEPRDLMRIRKLSLRNETGHCLRSFRETRETKV